MKPKQLYFCSGCRQVHYDNDFDTTDGDLLIRNKDKFLKSVNEHFAKSTNPELSANLIEAVFKVADKWGYKGISKECGDDFCNAIRETLKCHKEAKDENTNKRKVYKD